MDTDQKWFLRLSDGRQFGPADVDTLAQWAREGRIPETARLVSPDGEQQRSVLSVEKIQNIVRAPPTVRDPTLRPPRPTAPALIPYTNSKALTAYYLSVGGLIPGLGLPLAIAAVVLGVMGFRAWRADRAIKGAAHAWVAIILGLIELTAYALIVGWILTYP